MRWLTCKRCQEVVGVEELPAEFLDPDDYVCGECLQPIDGQLDLDGIERNRLETVSYDPARSAWPAGF